MVRCLGGVLAFGLGALLVAGCGDGEIAPRRALTTQAEEGARFPDQVIEDGTHIGTREGVKKAALAARRISFYNVEEKVEADTMEVDFYDANGVRQSRLNALFGEIDQRTNDMLARGKVLIVSEEGTRVEGEEFRYDAARDMIVSTQPVTIYQNGNRIRGKGLETDTGLTNIRLTGSTAVLRSAPRVGRREREREGQRGDQPSASAQAPPARRFPPAAGAAAPSGTQPGAPAGAQPGAPSGEQPAANATPAAGTAPPPSGAPSGGQTAAPQPAPPAAPPAQAAGAAGQPAAPAGGAAGKDRTNPAPPDTGG